VRPALAVDAGQTEIRVALAGERDPGRAARAPGVMRLDGAAVNADEVAGALVTAVDALGPLPALAAIGVGLSGFEAAREDDLRHVGELLRARVGAARVTIASDGVTSLLGDSGSAFAIGRSGFDAGLRELDGRGGSKALLAAAEQRFGPAAEIAEAVYRSAVPTRTVASFARDVARVATEGDAAARSILETAGSELALSACAALARAFDPGDPVAVVSYAGSVFDAGSPLMDAFARELARRRPDAELVPPEADALAGAGLLAERGADFAPDRSLLWSST